MVLWRSFIIIASVLITLINVIRAFNVLTTRKLPQLPHIREVMTVQK